MTGIEGRVTMPPCSMASAAWGWLLDQMIAAGFGILDCLAPDASDAR
jgi:hypothetical protein